MDMKQWLLDMGVKPDALDAVLPALAPAGDNIEKFGLRQSDYSQKMDAIRIKQTELETANTRLNDEMLEWAETQANGGQVTEAMRTDLAKARGEVARLQTVITTKATELGLDPKVVIGEVEPVKEPVREPKEFDAGPLSNRIDNVASFLLNYDADIDDIAHEHQQLTGERLPRREILTELRARAGDRLNRNADGTFKKPVDVRSIWEEKYDIKTKQSAKATATHEAEIRAAEDRGREQARSEQVLPGATPVGRHSPVLKSAGADGHSKAPRPSQVHANDRITAAASALATHKYAQKSGAGAR